MLRFFCSAQSSGVGKCSTSGWWHQGVPQLCHLPGFSVLCWTVPASETVKPVTILGVLVSDPSLLGPVEAG